MAVLKLNNIIKNNANNLVLFNTNPNIFSVENSSLKTKAKGRINITTLTPTSVDKPSIISFNGVEINGVDDIDKVVGRNFYRQGNSKGYISTTIINAFKSVGKLSMNYNFFLTEQYDILIESKNGGKGYDITLTSDNLNGITFTHTNGTDTDEMAGNSLSNIYLDIYKDNEFLTTLQKKYYGNSTSFNITPVISSVSDYDKLSLINLKAYATVDNKFIDLGEIRDNYVTTGYRVNQGDMFLDFNNYNFNIFPALNVKRGETRTLFNNSYIYIYKPEFKISLYKVGNTTEENVRIIYLEADETLVDGYQGETVTLNLTDNKLDIYTISLNEEKMRNAYYIDLQFSFGIIRLNVINPPYSNIECNRVFWNNSYGGISFFDFVGKKIDTRTTNVTTYDKSLLNYYKNDIQEKEIIYYRENKLDVKLTTHLIDKNGLYQLYDLQNSYRAWININNVNYYIIIKAIDVQEVSDNVYSVSIKYNYSLL